MQIEALDHLVLTVRDKAATIDFYTRVLNMEQVTFGNGRTALRFGQQKINIHDYGNEFEPKAAHPLPGSADLCFITRTPLTDVEHHLCQCGVEVVEGPVRRTGATRSLLSIYCRDPDGNLIEIANYAH